MTLTPFRGRCHTCGYDHDAEGQSLRDILDTHYAAKQEALAEVERLRVEQQSWRQKEQRAVREAIEALAERDALMSALQQIVAVMGPKTPPCCEGCEYEWSEALNIARVALETPIARKDT